MMSNESKCRAADKRKQEPLEGEAIDTNVEFNDNNFRELILLDECESLSADASMQEVMDLWEGAGSYARLVLTKRIAALMKTECQGPDYFQLIAEQTDSLDEDVNSEHVITGTFKLKDLLEWNHV